MARYTHGFSDLGLEVPQRSKSEVVHRENTTDNHQEALLLDTVNTKLLLQHKGRGFLLKEKRTHSVPFFASSSQIWREDCSLEYSAFFLLDFEVQSYLFLSSHVSLVLGIQFMPREGMARPYTSSSSVPRHTCLINIKFICFDATPVFIFFQPEKTGIIPVIIAIHFPTCLSKSGSFSL